MNRGATSYRLCLPPDFYPGTPSALDRPQLWLQCGPLGPVEICNQPKFLRLMRPTRPLFVNGRISKMWTTAGGVPNLRGDS